MMDTYELSSKDIQAIDAAKLYYSGLSQDEVAKQLKLSRPTVSKLLQYALKRGFVTITVHDPRINNNDIIELLTKKYGLTEVRLVYPPAVSDEAVIRQALGAAAAQMLDEVICDGDIVGISWSRTIEDVSTQLKNYEKKNVQIVQLRGGVEGGRNGLSELDTLNRFARAFRAQVHLLNLPSIFDSIAVKTAVEQESHVRKILNLAEKARVAVFTVGDTHPDAYLLNNATIHHSERKILSTKAVGDICSRFIDEQGRICLPDLNNRTVAISLPQLRHTPQKILIAGGKKKLKAIHVALSYGYANRLVIDKTTAENLIQLD